ncbi:MAG TPA: hypothetical protein VIA62_07265 [Thermoanaerobaculia bacterium]|jgi:hypothetical protein|nr:hypothetical protein [Thermoanaerobaculia bacterium]
MAEPQRNLHPNLVDPETAPRLRIEEELEVMVAAVIAWLEDYHAQLWDEQIEENLGAGRLDSLLAEVDDEYEAGLAQPL